MFNEFFPRGGFRGYDEALAAPYGAEYKSSFPAGFVFKSDRPLNSVGNPSAYFTTYSREVSEKFHAEIGVPQPHEPALLPVQPHEWPAEYVYEKAYKRHASIVEFSNRMYAAEDALREIIERLDPGVHQFNPVRVLLPKGVAHPVTFHMMIVGRWLNSFSLADSEPTSLQDVETTAPRVFPDNKKGFGGVAMQASVIGGAHFWREKSLGRPTFLLSDVLKAEVGKAGLRLPPHFKMKSV